MYEMVLNNELYHHGILGQKWGIRRYQNSDGSLTEAGKKRYYKDVKKEFEKRGFKSVYVTDNDFKSKVTNSVKNIISKEDINKLVNAKEKWLKLSSNVNDFYDSKEYETAISNAYQNTIDYLKKIDPDYLNKIVELNKKAGREPYSELDNYHDFRKALEGMEDEEIDKAIKIWEKTDSGKSSKEADKAFNEYYKIRQNIIYDIIGTYGDNKMLQFSPSQNYKDLIDNNIDWDEVAKVVEQERRT